MSTKYRVFSHDANCAIDPPLYSKSAAEAQQMIESGRADRLGSRRAIRLRQVAAPISRADVVNGNLDHAISSFPVGYRASSPSQLMFGQMWEKRMSAGFEVMQLCPPISRRDVTPESASA